MMMMTTGMSTSGSTGVEDPTTIAEDPSTSGVVSTSGGSSTGPAVGESSESSASSSAGETSSGETASDESSSGEASSGGADSEGLACTFNKDCPPSAPFCGDDNQCHDGGEGDSCQFDCDPELAPFCIDNVCHDGSDGDPCVFDSDCGAGSPHCIEEACQDGGVGDPCVFDKDCMDGLKCVNKLCA